MMKKIIMSFVSLVLVFGMLISIMPAEVVEVSASSNTMPSSGSVKYKVIDLSQWNDNPNTNSDNIDFRVLKQNVDAAYFRAICHDNSGPFIDAQADNFAKSAEKEGLPFGFYYYFYPRTSDAESRRLARLFYDFIKQYDYSLIPVLDVEEATEKGVVLSNRQINASINAFADEFKKVSGQDIMIYSYPWFIDTYLDSSLSKYKLWIANWNVSAPRKNNIWSEWAMWQYTSTATVAGVPGSRVDMNWATDDIFINWKDVETVNIQAHVQSYGWQNWIREGRTAGTSGESKRLESVKLQLQNIDGGIEYKTHVQSIGWTGWSRNGQESGSTGRGLRLEALQIRLTGEAAKKYDIYYRVHIERYGWLGWAKNGQSAGSEAHALRMEAIEVRLVPKGYAAPGSTTRSFVGRADLSVDAHVQSIGWQGTRTGESVTVGTSGRALRMEALKINLLGADGSISYRTHVQSIGWQNRVNNGATAGTSGRALRLEALELSLSGNIARTHDIYYRVHAQGYGWLDWTKNGQPAGTAGQSLRLEAIEIRLIAKNRLDHPRTGNRAYIAR